MAHSIAEAFTKEKSDEMYTPASLVEILKPYFDQWLIDFKMRELRVPSLPDRKVIVWCGADTADSEYVHFFKQYPDVEVIHSHIDEGKDFFTYEPKEWDIFISNIPFKLKLPWIKRLMEFGKPFAVLVNSMYINYMEVGNYFADNPIQMLIPDKRVSCDGNPSSFNLSYTCKDFLPRDLIFCHMDNCNSGKDFIPSRMYK